MNSFKDTKETKNLIAKKSELNFVMMIGISGAGKTFVANQIKKELNDNTIKNNWWQNIKQKINKEKTIDEHKCILLSSDDIRLKEQITTYDWENNKKVFNIMNALTIKSLKNNISVVYDATNLTIKGRHSILKMIEDNNIKCTKIAYIMPTNIFFAKSQNKKRPRTVPEEVIERQYKSFQFPVEEECFDEIEIHNFQLMKTLMTKDRINLTKNNKETQCFYNNINSYFNLIKDFNQNNKHHDYLLGEHSVLTAIEIKNKIIRREINIDKSFHNSLILAGYLHDYGKPFDFLMDNYGEYHYPSHANIGAYKLLSLCPFIWSYLSWETFLNFLRLVNYHMDVFQWNNMSDKTLYNRKKRYGDKIFKGLKFLHEADINNSKKNKEK